MKRSGSRRPLVATLLAASLVIAACGGDDDADDEEIAEEADGDDAADAGEDVADTADDATEDTADDGADDGADDEAAPEDADTGGDGGEDAADDDGDGDDGDGADATAGGEETGDDMAMAPVRGGTLTYLVEGESDTWDIPSANCTVPCMTIMRQVAEPLMAVNSEGEAEPFLLESLEPNADFTEFTMTMRDGITFHDGTPADGAAVQRNFQEMAQGILHGQVLIDLVGGLDGIELIDPMTVKVTFSKPFATFPYNIAERTGYLLAPAFWDNPERAGALAIGTGPFRMTEWTRDERTVLEANPEYWRTDAAGEPLPYLDGIVFRPIPDVSARRATMEAGDADANHDDFGENLEFWRGEWVEGGGKLADQPIDRATAYLLLNNGSSPFDNPEFRRAVALCTDRNEYMTFVAPLNTLANGPFAEGALGYLEDSGFPEFDPVAGSALLDEIGRPEEILFGTTNVPSNLLTAELFADMWTRNCGLTVNIDQFDQSQLITKAISGDFQVFLWRNHGQRNPGLEYVWWHSRHAVGLALNFGRIQDPDLDALLDETWTTNDPGELDRLGQEINRLFGEQVYNIWLEWAEWEVPYQANVHDVGVLTLPSGDVVRSSVNGRVWLHEAFKEG